MLSLAEFMSNVLLSAFASSPRTIRWWSSAPDFGRVGLVRGGSPGRMGFASHLRVLRSLDLVIFLVQALSAGPGAEADVLDTLHNVMFGYCA
ncbi:uncharacterized protein N7484_006158 [Penicillium longicatenatum]|jgi:hypothetical protein|uniref:uncharacterized protein n=1 Tax=Penicillium longicatenatum TaxID=1561947 RepID=UPI0025475B34|nr:uncharacterized protein N7484_006158 [Penicillium longicatenatum]KAJ5643651.1 hypothetical protein N7484_006158 [Penicillium longicatenatum]